MSINKDSVLQAKNHLLVSIQKRIASKNSNAAVSVDRFGHIRLVENNNEYRYVFKERVVRFEKKILIEYSHGERKNEWYRLKSYNLSEIINKIQNL
jgi:hypothetical protein